MQGDHARRYDYAFLSYATEDRVEALKCARDIRAVGMRYFQDLLSIDPGDRWKRKLILEIEKSDVFLLLWSSTCTGESLSGSSARPSTPNSMPTTTASRPQFRPIILGRPPVVPPPKSLEQFQFNDVLNYVILGVEAERARKAAKRWALSESLLFDFAQPRGTRRPAWAR